MRRKKEESSWDFHFYFSPLLSAHSLDEVEEKTKALRESVNYTAANDASNVEVTLSDS
jgi:hypothetical protein